MFSRAEVQDVMNKFILVQLYCDYVPKKLYPASVRETITDDQRESDGDKNGLFERDRFDTAQQPLYVIIEPTANDFLEVDRYDVGVISDIPEYLRFLSEGLTKAPKKK